MDAPNPRPCVGWRVWTQSEVFCSDTHSWSDVPGTGIQILVTYDDLGGRNFTYGQDEYSIEGESDVKLGEWMGDEEFYALVRSAEDVWWS